MRDDIELTVFSLERQRIKPDDPGYILLLRTVPSAMIYYRLALKTPVKDGKAFGDDIEPLLGNTWKDPVVKLHFFDGTYIELSKFNPDDLKRPYQITKFERGDCLISDRVIPFGLMATLAFIDYPSDETGCDVDVLDGNSGKNHNL